MHKDAMRSLLVHVFLTAVRDAQMMAQGQRHEDVLPDNLEKWTDSVRFEFWSEWLDLPADTVEAVLLALASGAKQPELRSRVGLHKVKFKESSHERS